VGELGIRQEGEGIWVEKRYRGKGEES